MADMGNQVAALPLRRGKKRGKIDVLLVTSRGARQWVVPKGWEMDGKTPWAAARIEALEEAGATGRIVSRKVGSYKYPKALDNGSTRTCRVRVYPMAVKSLKKSWKERKQRTRRWFPLKEAAERVGEKDLSRLLASLSKNEAKDFPKSLRKRLC